MKNRLYYFVLILVLSFSFINNVYAADVKVEAISDKTEVVTGSDVSIKIKLTSNEKVDRCEFRFSAAGENIYAENGVNVHGANGWGYNTVSSSITEAVNASSSVEFLKNGQNILELKYNVVKDVTFSITNIICYVSDSEETHTNEDISIDFTTIEPIDDTTLSSVTVTGDGGLVTKNGSSYIIKLNSPSFGLSMNTTDSKYQNSISVRNEDGNEIVDVSDITYSDPSGKGGMLLFVTINDTTTYDFFITYVETDLDNTLKTLTVNGKEISLVPGKYNYQYTVGKSIDEIEVDATLSDSVNFKFGDKSNAPGTFTINDVTNVTIIIEPKKSSSGTTSLVYTLEIVKEGNNGSGTGGSGSTSTTGGSSNNINRNPVTGDISMYLMAFVLIASLVGSLVLYRKNLESYK